LTQPRQKNPKDFRPLLNALHHAIPTHYSTQLSHLQSKHLRFSIFLVWVSIKFSDSK
jgi:hypothetical protein